MEGSVELLAWKLRITTLWIFFAVGMSAAMILGIVGTPGLLDDIASGEVEGMKIDATILIFMALFWLVPLTMAFLTLVLRDPINRYANAIVGIVATAMWAWDFAEHLSTGLEISGEPLVVVTLIIAGLLIVWHAWRWPKPTGSTV